MTNTEFNKLIEAANLKQSVSLEAARLVLVKNYNRSQAARELGIAQPTVTAMLHKIPTGICKYCGHAVKNN